MTRRKILLGITALAVIAFVTWGSLYPTRALEWDGLVEAREIRLQCVDGEGKPVSNIEVQHRRDARPGLPPHDWQPVPIVTTHGAETRFGIGNRGASGGERHYFWGLFKTERRDHPVVEYRVIYRGSQQGSWTEEQLMTRRIEEILTPDQTVFAQVNVESFCRPDGRIAAASMRLRVQ